MHLKNTFHLTITSLLFICLAACSPQTSPSCASDSWEIIGQVDFGQPTISVMFRDLVVGIATDLGGGIHYTEDGGKTWNFSTDAGSSRVALDMDKDTIWHVAYGGALLRSTDNGHTWEYISQLTHSGHIEYISFSDLMNGWFVSTEVRKLFVTADGGKTWNAMSLPDGMGRVASIQQRTTDEGYLLDTARKLFITHDGGLTWMKRSIPAIDGLTIPDQNHSAALRFIDENNGLVALNLVGGGTSKVYVLRTTDRGSTWTDEPLPLSIGMFFLTRDGTLLTHVDLLDHSKFTLLCAPESNLKPKP